MSENLKFCNFCGKSEVETRNMFSSDEASICGECVNSFFEKMVKEKVREEMERSESRVKCSFCGKSESRVKYMFSSGECNICDECVEYCHDMLLQAEHDSGKNKSDKKVGCIDD